MSVQGMIIQKKGLMTNGKSPKSRGDLHENATAKQIPKQDLKITSKIKPREKHRQGTSKRRKKQNTQDIHKEGDRTRRIGGTRIDVRLDLDESSRDLEHTRINGIWDAYRAKARAWEQSFFVFVGF